MIPIAVKAPCDVPSAASLTPLNETVPIVAKAIMIANLGFNPMNNGDNIIISVPPLTEERRKEYIKMAKTKGEDAKVAIRNVRRAVKEALEKLEKDGAISKDDLSRSEKDLEKITGDHTSKIDELLKHKEAELLKV